MTAASLFKQGSGRPPYRADHVGSLLRPKALRDAFKQHMKREIDDAAFTKVMDACILDVLKMQEDIGLKVANDGEFRRGSYWSRFVERVAGFEIRQAIFKFRDDSGHEMDFTAPYANGKIARRQPLALDEYQFIRVHTKLEGKITLPAPSTMHFYRATDFADKSVYQDQDKFFEDLSRAFQQEIAELVKAGCTYVQLDEVALAMLCDPSIRAQVTSFGADPDKLVDLYIEAINQAVAGAPDNVAIGVHVCRGNFKGHYMASGGYDSVAEKFFANTRVNHFLLEYDTARSGDFAPLRFVPKSRGVVLGLVSSKTPALETLDDLKRRTDEATKYIDLDRLGISPQCGFASTVAGNPVTEADERAKLSRVVEASRVIWGA